MSTEEVARAGTMNSGAVVDAAKVIVSAHYTQALDMVVQVNSASTAAAWNASTSRSRQRG